MSWWTDIRDAVEAPVTYAAGLIPGLVKNKNDKDAQQQNRLISDQIKAYQDQTNLTKQELANARTASDAEKRKIQETQIRSLRRSYRAQGANLLGQGQPATQDMNTNLGG